MCVRILLMGNLSLRESASTAALMHGYLRYAKGLEFHETIMSLDEKMKRSESDVAAKACVMKTLSCATPHAPSQVSECRLMPLPPPSKNFVIPSPCPHSQIIPLYFPHKCHQSALDLSACPANQTAGPLSPTSPTSAARRTMKSSRYVIPPRRKLSNQ